MHPPLGKLRLILLTFALGLGTFIRVLDSSIANVALPAITGNLGASSHEGIWIITSFTASNAIVLPLTGWLARQIGEVRLFVWSTALFALASFLCALAPSIQLLIFFRILQGAVAGSLIPLSQSLLLQNYPAQKKGLALSFWSMIVILAPIAGPVLGGWITDNHGWPWVFLINVPLGLCSAVFTFYLLQGRESDIAATPIDFVGFGLLIAFVSSLQILLDQGETLDWFNSTEIVILATISLCAFILFIIWEWHCLHPVVNLKLFLNRNFSIGTLTSTLGFMMVFSGMVLLPLWLQGQMGYTALWSGLAVAPIGLFSLILSPLIGKYSRYLDPRLLVSVSFIAFGSTYFWFSLLNTQATIDNIAWIRLFQGIGLACFFIPLVSIALKDIEQKHTAAASGVFNFVRLMAGGGAGSSLSMTLWNRRQALHRLHLVEQLSPQQVAAVPVLHSMPNEMALAYIDRSIGQEAAILGLNDIFFLCSILSFALCAVIWLTKGKRQTAAAVEAPH